MLRRSMLMHSLGSVECDRPVYQQMDHVTTTGPSALSWGEAKWRRRRCCGRHCVTRMLMNFIKIKQDMYKKRHVLLCYFNKIHQHSCHTSMVIVAPTSRVELGLIYQHCPVHNWVCYDCASAGWCQAQLWVRQSVTMNVIAVMCHVCYCLTGSTGHCQRQYHHLLQLSWKTLRDASEKVTDLFETAFLTSDDASLRWWVILPRSAVCVWLVSCTVEVISLWGDNDDDGMVHWLENVASTALAEWKSWIGNIG